VHHLQAEAELVIATTDLSLLVDFHRDKLGLRQRHVAVAKLVADYAFNNTYQYVIAREDVHLAWIEAAIAQHGGTPTDVAEPSLTPLAKKESPAPLMAADAQQSGDFVSRWRPRLTEIKNARDRSMMQVVLGETLEQKRFFDQMIAGREDLLGRRANGPGRSGTGDGVLPVRWIE
jgi:hypothetical protein